jgi:hypothetical protein
MEFPHNLRLRPDNRFNFDNGRCRLRITPTQSDCNAIRMTLVLAVFRYRNSLVSDIWDETDVCAIRSHLSLEDGQNCSLDVKATAAHPFSALRMGERPSCTGRQGALFDPRCTSLSISFQIESDKRRKTYQKFRVFSFSSGDSCWIGTRKEDSSRGRRKDLI